MATRLTTLIVVAIVAATLIAGLIVGAQRDDANGPVDLIIFNGKVYPADGGGQFKEAVAVRGNQILRVGSNRDIKRLRRAQTLVLDAHGGAVVPGFNDAHVRLIDGALALDQMDLSEERTLKDIQEEVRAYAAANPTQPWIVGRGWRADAFPAGLPTRLMLDTIESGRPIFLTSDDGQIGWANSKALELAGITRRTKSPQRGAIARHPATGEPTGILKNGALKLMRAVLPEPSHLEKVIALRAAIAEAHRLGVTSVQTVSANAEELDLLSEIRRQGDLTLRVYGTLAVTTAMKDADVEQLDGIRKRYPDDPMLKTGAVDIDCDPPQGGSGDTPRPSTRSANQRPACSAAEIERVVTLLDKHHWQIVVHAAAGADVRAALDAFEHAAAANPEPPGSRRHRIEDVDTIDPADVPRLKQIGVIAEPSHPDVPEPTALSAEAEAPTAEAESSMWNLIGGAGVRMLFGSDWPEAPMDPRLAIDRVVNPSDLEVSPDVPAQTAGPLLAAIDAYTSNASYASFDEHRKGTLAPGMLADILILSADIFEGSPERVKDAVVDVTIFDGKIVYRRDTQTTDQ